MNKWIVSIATIVRAKALGMIGSPFRLTTLRLTALIVTVAVATTIDGQVSAQGLVSPGLGAVNRSMGGASTAAPVDTIGSLHWNPATIVNVPNSFEIGYEVPLTNFHVSSSLLGASGEDRSDAGVLPLVSSALVYAKEDSCWSVGLGIYTIGGLFTNFPASTTNPILTPQPPLGAGVGSVFTKLALLQIAPTLAVQLTDRVSIGFSPTITTAELMVSPNTLAPPNDANGDTFFTYSPGGNTHLHWGGGFQVGIYATTDSGWDYGLSFKSPQWMETFEFNSVDELGLPLTQRVGLDYPMIVSGGVAYRGLERWLFAADLRFTDYENTKGFSRSGFGPTGAVEGLGWKSVVSLHLGGSYDWTERTRTRIGYLYTENPIREELTAFNVGAAAFYQHSLCVGLEHDLSQTFSVAASYCHLFDSHIEGPYQTPLGPVPGSRVALDLNADLFSFNLRVRY
ncbi:MAG TPA: outer membrane protein transport protein [Pirellulaceae bacterium]|nr:outer membrane protein transport protein [Pirellulaceae bacterium]